MPATSSHAVFEPIDLGRMPYAEALEVQRRLHAEVLNGRRPAPILLLEHDPVITISKRDAAPGHLLATQARLRELGVEVCRTDRGGDITYHGPGQLVAYPILPLEPLGLNLRSYVRLLEQVVIDTAGAFGVEAQRDACAVGVWAAPPNQPEHAEAATPTTAKLAAIGVRVRRWVTMHGLALNVTTDLAHFDLIVPCGLARPVTSLRQLLGDACPSMAQVRDVMIDAFRNRLVTQPLTSS